MTGTWWHAAAGAARLSGRAGLAASRAGRSAGRASAGRLERAQADRGTRAASRGLLAPGDPPPGPGAADHLDYRGLAGPRDVRRAEGGDVPLGRVIDARRGAGRPIGLDHAALDRHAVVVGSSGSGKTSSVVVPWIVAALAAGDDVVAVDVKGDLLSQVLAYQEAVRPLDDVRVVVWDVARPARSTSWSWLFELDRPEAFAAVAQALVGRERPDDPQPFFGQRDRRLLEALLRAVRAVQPAAPQSELVVAAARDQSVLRELAVLAGPEGAALREAALVEPWEFGRVMSGVLNAVQFLDHPGVAAVTRRDELRLAQVLDGPRPTLLVASAPLEAGPVGTRASALMIALVQQQLYRRFGTPTARRASLFLDEAARLKDRVDLEELLSIARGARVSVTLALQTVEQLADDAERHAVLDNCETFIQVPSASVGAAHYLQRRLGEHVVPTVSTNVDFSGWSSGTRRGVARGLEQRPVLGVRELMSPPWGGRVAFVHAPSVTRSPIAVDLTRPDLVDASGNG